MAPAVSGAVGDGNSAQMLAALFLAQHVRAHREYSPRIVAEVFGHLVSPAHEVVHSLDA